MSPDVWARAFHWKDSHRKIIINQRYNRIDFLNGGRELESGDFQCPFTTAKLIRVREAIYNLKDYADWNWKMT